MAFVYIFIGGGLGSICRYGVALLFAEHGFKLPIATIVANILAGLILGMFVGISTRQGGNQTLLLLGAIGFCGGFSTFSTFSFENVELWQNGHFTALILNVVGSVVLCFGSVWLGLKASEFLT